MRLCLIKLPHTSLKHSRPYQISQIAKKSITNRPIWLKKIFPNLTISHKLFDDDFFHYHPAKLCIHDLFRHSVMEHSCVVWDSMASPSGLYWAMMVTVCPALFSAAAACSCVAFLRFTPFTCNKRVRHTFCHQLEHPDKILTVCCLSNWMWPWLFSSWPSRDKICAHHVNT